MNEKTKTRLRTTWKICLILTLLYLFICSLDLLSTGFQLLVGKGAGEFFSDADSLLKNPIVGLMIGVLGTVLLQSSSTFTSIIISMVGPTFLDPKDAVPIIMGSNIGTSVTSTLVAMTQAGDRNSFKRAFSAATVHDMFNWCAVLVLLPIEIISGYLYYTSDAIATAIVGDSTDGINEIKTIQYITEPLTELIVMMNGTVLEEWAVGNCDNCTLLMIHCPEIDSPDKCKYLLNVGDPLEDWVAGLIVTIMALIILCGALIMMVKLLNSLLQGALSNSITRVLNPKFEGRCASYWYDYFVILVGAALTFLVQSSSVFTSTITPLVGMGLLELATVYPLFLGANLGTTTTGMLAALASDPTRLHDAMQVAFVHLLFNISGILIFFPIPFTRIPIPLAKLLGKTTAKYRWFALAYLVVMFLLLPLSILLLSLNDIVFVFVGTPCLLIFIFAVTVNVMQNKCPKYLPKFLRTWDWLPKPLHSLGVYDRIFTGWKCCDRFRISDDELEEVLETTDIESGGGSPDGDNKSDDKDAASTHKDVKLARTTSSSSSGISSASNSGGQVNIAFEKDPDDHH